MTRITAYLKKSLLTSFLVIFAVAPLSGILTGLAAADCTPPPSDTAGVHWPTGADAGTFTYHCEDGPYKGEWTNDYYVYDPSTSQRTALYPPEYGYDCNTGIWTMAKWYYSPGTDSFYKTRIQTADPGGMDTNCPVAANQGGGNAGGGNNSSQSIAGTGPDSSNGSNSNGTFNNNTTNNNNLLMTNGLNSQANTGNAGVFSNTSAGSALTGDATSIANIANLLQSSSNVFGPDTTLFTADINGDVNGDFMFDPSAILSDTGPNSSNTANNNLTVNNNTANNTNAQINNNIDVGANTGDAAVANNTSGGDATSGNAHAIVNLMNVINSTIQSGHSFIGNININGNLNGDILLPANLINALLASSGPNSSNTENNNVTNNSSETNTNNLGVNNNVTSSSQTGSANVSNNTSAGSANSGTASNNTTMLNLTGSNVVGKNDLLVFVNVLGHWVGMIVNAPAGSNAAELGSGISNTGPNSSNTTNNNVTTNDTTNNTNNLGINNNVNVHARSGNANVSGNTAGGSARSGNADTAVNIVNIEGVNINLSDWFGVLFINVFGDWTGSFGVNTSAGDPIAPAAGNGASVPASFKFVPNPAVAAASTSSPTASSTTPQGGANSGSSSNGQTLGASVKAAATIPATARIDDTQKTFNKLFIPAVGVTLAFVILVAGERRQSRGARLSN